MTKDEVITWMRLGAKCEHKYFSTGEWVTIKEDGETYLFEDGVECSEEEFWNFRTEPYWDTDWEFAQGWDPFVCIAAREYKCLISEVNSAMRNNMKLKYFALHYGGNEYFRF